VQSIYFRRVAAVVVEGDLCVSSSAKIIKKRLSRARFTLSSSAVSSQVRKFPTHTHSDKEQQIHHLMPAYLLANLPTYFVPCTCFLIAINFVCVNPCEREESLRAEREH
jgi:hypothetical protein